MNEVSIHRSLNHDGVVKFETCFEDSKNIYFLLELCPKQSLKQVIKKKKTLTEVEVQPIMHQLFSALTYLHRNNIMHRDLKLENIFISDNYQIKIGDFGLAARNKFEGHKRRTFCGTPNYLAPEIIKREGHSFEVDLWSCGAIMYTLLFGKNPYDAGDIKSTFKNILNRAFTFPSNISISNEAKLLIDSLFIVDPNKRQKLNSILTHSFFNSQIQTLPDNWLGCFDNLHSANNDNNNDKCLHYTTSNLPSLYIIYWVDYLKYGMSYMLSNGTIGVIFKDYTKMIMTSKEHVDYIEKHANNSSITEYSLVEYPENMKKKITLFQHFRANLERKAQKNKTTFSSAHHEPHIYANKWISTKQASLFILSSHVMQLDLKDHTQIIYFVDTNLIFYLNKAKESAIMPSDPAFQQRDDIELQYRISYLRSLISYIKSSELNPETVSIKPL